MICFDTCPTAACLPFAAARIAAITPAAKLVFVLRDPIEASFSAELRLRNAGVRPAWSFMEDVLPSDPRFAETKEDVAFWAAAAKMGAGEPLPADLPERLHLKCGGVLRAGAYAELLRPFFEHFPKEK
jgi:hypothetical protein